MNTKGSVIDIILFMILAVVVLFVLGVLLYLTNTIGDQLTSIPTQGDINFSQVAEPMVTPLKQGANAYLKIIAIVILFGMIITIFISNFLIKGHPVFYIVYVLITIVGVGVAAYISNAWMDNILTTAELGPTLQTFDAGNFMMQYLPYFIAVMGIFGAIFLFVGVLKDSNEGI